MYRPAAGDRVQATLKSGHTRKGVVHVVNSQTRRAAVRLDDNQYYGFSWDELQLLPKKKPLQTDTTVHPAIAMHSPAAVKSQPVTVPLYKRALQWLHLA